MKFNSFFKIKKTVQKKLTEKKAQMQFNVAFRTTLKIHGINCDEKEKSENQTCTDQDSYSGLWFGGQNPVNGKSL